ncbi:hypothetical protein CJ030_MR6G021604 [Morella rubra]|uniref:Late embryogenesis abundant protein LEA-2 subgroup domain-containing protein n=1 Tax=Morella rubra TaxID=262757 RepID=A0A6A1VGA8_9ROSI|nr:hypothetical protein CJ030_MR6G021604 [Morella rubra]
MVDQKINTHVFPLTPANQSTKSCEESATSQSDQELRRKKRIKWAIYIVAFLVFQILVITAFSLTVMRFKNPKVRLGEFTVQNLTTGTQTSPSFDINIAAQVKIKNTNFGPYKYDSTNATFMYRGLTVGQATIPKGKAGMLSTKKISVTVNVNSDALPNASSLGSDLNARVLTLNSHAKLNGKVTLMLVMKKKKSPEMNCTMTINLSTKAVQALNCK